MEFSFPFKLKDGTAVEVTAEFSKEDDLIGLTFPIGCRLATCLFEAYTRVDEIQERAEQVYRERLENARFERAAGVT